MPQIERDYIKTGKLKYVFSDFPIESIHSKAFKAHEAANCAGDQGKYWEMHSQLFAKQRALDLKNLSGYAEDLGLDMTTFGECLKGGKHTAEIRKDMAEGAKAGIRGTPSFLIGYTEADGKLKALQIIRGAQPYSRFKQTIESLLTQEKK